MDNLRFVILRKVINHNGPDLERINRADVYTGIITSILQADKLTFPLRIPSTNRMNSKVILMCAVLAVAVLLQSTPTQAAWGSCLSEWKTISGIGILMKCKCSSSENGAIAEAEFSCSTSDRRCDTSRDLPESPCQPW